MQIEEAAELCYKLARLSSHDEDGSENVAKKMNLRPFKLHRVYLDPLNLSNVGRFLLELNS